MNDGGSTHRCHEHAKKTTHAKTHHAGYHRFAKARLHHRIHLEAGVSGSVGAVLRKGTYGFNVGIVGIVCSPRWRRDANSWKVVHDGWWVVCGVGLEIVMNWTE